MKNGATRVEVPNELSNDPQYGRCTGTDNACAVLVPIFNHLEKDQMDEVNKMIRTVTYKKGETIYRAGDTINSLYIIRQGRAKISRLSESGKEQLLRILHPGDFTGELALFTESISEAYAETLENTVVCMVKRADLRALLCRYPAIALKLLAELAGRLERSEKQTTRFATEKVETRIALFLAECVDNNEPSGEIVLPMRKKELASYLGTTPETISRKLMEFETLGYIKQKTNRRIEIVALDELLLV